MAVAVLVLVSAVTAHAAKAPQAPVIARLSLSDLADQAVLICVCHMTEQRSEWDGEKNMLMTVVTLQTEELLKGAAEAGSDLQVELFSSFTNQPLNIFGGAVFEQGERAVLFLKPAGDAAGKHYHIVGWAQGKFTVRTNPTTGEERVERNLQGIHFSPSISAGTAGGSEMPTTLNDLRTAIRTVVPQAGGTPPSP
jgi:hypothetical protein